MLTSGCRPSRSPTPEPVLLDTRAEEYDEVCDEVVGADPTSSSSASASRTRSASSPVSDRACRRRGSWVWAPRSASCRRALPRARLDAGQRPEVGAPPGEGTAPPDASLHARRRALRPALARRQRPSTSRQQDGAIPMSRPDVSVIIVSYNTKDLTQRCVQHLLDSRSDDVGFDVTVVDNASADGSAEAICATFPEVRLIRLARNVGWGRASIAARSRAPAAPAVLQPDTTRSVTRSRAYRFARQHPEHGIYTAALCTRRTDDVLLRVCPVCAATRLRHRLSAAFPNNAWLTQGLPAMTGAASGRTAVSGCACSSSASGSTGSRFDPQVLPLQRRHRPVHAGGALGPAVVVRTRTWCTSEAHRPVRRVSDQDPPRQAT